MICVCLKHRAEAFLGEGHLFFNQTRNVNLSNRIINVFGLRIFLWFYGEKRCLDNFDVFKQSYSASGLNQSVVVV